MYYLTVMHWFLLFLCSLDFDVANRVRLDIPNVLNFYHECTIAFMIK